MSIKKLPPHLVNKLKAWEIVERPFSVVKELVENSIDAGASKIKVSIWEGGKKLIKVEDDGSWIPFDQLELAIDRYATSKIASEEDLLQIKTMGFRGEALAAISEVSKFRLQSKIVEQDVGGEIVKIGEYISKTQIPFDKPHWTTVLVEDLFYNIPVRKKYLKSTPTEQKYIQNRLTDFAIVNSDISLIFERDWKPIWNLLPQDTMQRIIDILGRSFDKHLYYFEKSGKDYSVQLIRWDSTLRFSSPDFVKIFVNKRPVKDKLLQKAVMDAFYRQMTHWEYPFVVLFLDVNPALVDVNIHPRKLEVKFQDPGSMFNFVKWAVEESLGENKISTSTYDDNFLSGKSNLVSGGSLFTDSLWNKKENFGVSVFSNPEGSSTQLVNNQYQLIWQLRNMYIVLQDEDNLYLVDQHALAERIIFEKLKKDVEQKWLQPTPLLAPLALDVVKTPDLEEKLEQLNSLWFDVSLLGEQKAVVYAIPSVFSNYKMDLEWLLKKLFTQDKVDLDKVLDVIWATKACKAAIKAGDKLSFAQMKQLIEDAFEYIPGGFVCQHWRPFFIQMGKSDIDKMFDR